jgi:hypothetical protein
MMKKQLQKLLSFFTGNTLKWIMLLIILFGSVHTKLNAQANADKAKAYYYSAENEYKSRNFSKAIEYCQQVEDLLGKTNARVEALRLRSYFDNGDIEKAKGSLKTFLSLNANENLIKSVSPYIVKIEEAEKKRIRKVKEAEEARIKKEREAEEARIKKERQAKEARIKKEKEREELLANAHFSEGLAAVQSHGKMGYIDKEGNQVVPFIYDDAWKFNGGLAMVSKNEKEGFIDKKGNVIIPLKYYRMGSKFDEYGFTWFATKNTGSDKYTWPWEAGILNKKGDIIKSIATKEIAGDKNAYQEYQRRSYIYYWCAHYLIKNKASAKAIPLLKWVGDSGEDNEFKYKAGLALADIYFDLKDNISGFNAKEKALKYYESAYDNDVSLDTKQKLRLGDYYYNKGTASNKEKALKIYANNSYSHMFVPELSYKYIKTAIELKHHDIAEAKITYIEKNLWKHHKNDKDLCNLKGLLAESKGDMKAAKKWYKKANK